MIIKNKYKVYYFVNKQIAILEGILKQIFAKDNCFLYIFTINGEYEFINSINIIRYELQ